MPGLALGRHGGLPPSVKDEGRKVSNGLARFEVNAHGWIQSLFWDGKQVPWDEPLGQLLSRSSRQFDAWDIDRQSLSLGEVCDGKAEIAPWKDGEFCQRTGGHAEDWKTKQRDSPFCPGSGRFGCMRSPDGEERSNCGPRKAGGFTPYQIVAILFRNK